MKTVHFFLLLCVISLITSCVSSNTQLTASPNAEIIGDGGFLSETPCGPPCFYGLTPGESTKDEGLDFIKNKIGLQSCDIWDKRKVGGIQGAMCDSNLSFSFSSVDIIDTIGFAASNPIALADVIKKYGNPDVFSVSPYENDEGDIVSVYMSIFYDNKKMVVGFSDQEGRVFDLDQATKVNVIGYYENSLYERRQEILNTDIWRGYGEYQITKYDN